MFYYEVRFVSLLYNLFSLESTTEIRVGGNNNYSIVRISNHKISECSVGASDNDTTILTVTFEALR